MLGQQFSFLLLTALLWSYAAHSTCTQNVWRKWMLDWGMVWVVSGNLSTFELFNIRSFMNRSIEDRFKWTDINKMKDDFCVQRSIVWRTSRSASYFLPYLIYLLNWLTLVITFWDASKLKLFSFRNSKYVSIEIHF